MSKGTTSLVILLALSATLWCVLPRNGRGPASLETGDRGADVEPSRPLLTGRAAGVEGGNLLEAARLGDAAAWDGLVRSAPQLPDACRRELRDALLPVLDRAVHPTNVYRGGAGAVRLAAELCDPPLAERLLALLDDWERVVLKLPMTERRDDLLVLEAIEAGVARGGTKSQRTRLDAMCEMPSTYQTGGLER